MNNKKQIEEHLTDKSLVALSTLVQSNGMIKNFLKNLIPKWPEGRQALYDLLINGDKWTEVIFTYRPISYPEGSIVYEIRLVAQLCLDKADAFYSIVSKWPVKKPHELDKAITERDIFRNHMTSTRKIFKVKVPNLVKINYETLIYSKYFYSEKLINKRKTL